MGISIEHYRIKIGCFQPNFQKSLKVQKRTFVNNTTVSWLYILIYIYLAGISGSLSSRSSDYAIPISSSSNFQDPLQTFFKTSLMGFSGVSQNKISHMINGNKRSLGYKIASWNCGRGLMSGNNTGSEKLLDIKLFIEKHKPSLFGIIESDIHGVCSPSNRKTTFSKDDILHQLHIDGYTTLTLGIHTIRQDLLFM